MERGQLLARAAREEKKKQKFSGKDLVLICRRTPQLEYFQEDRWWTRPLWDVQRDRCSTAVCRVATGCKMSTDVNRGI